MTAGTASTTTEVIRCDLIASAVREYGEVQLRVTGDSMVPMLYPGTLVMIRKADFETVGLGALAAFQRNGRLFIHRVVFAAKGTIVTQGDAHSFPDPAVAKDEFIGLVTPVDSGQKKSVRRMLHRLTYRLASLISAALAGTI